MSSTTSRPTSAPRVSRPRRTHVWFGVAIIALTSVTGCQSPSRYVSPRVIGRVLDEQTHQPIAGVEVNRVVPNYAADTGEDVRGGEVLARTPPVRSATDGTFDLDSRKSVALFGQFAWFTLEISFAHRGYEQFTTNYTPHNAITSANGEPVIHAGDVWLKPKPK